MSTPSWLVAKPIAHRGLHNKSEGVIENTVSAAEAAIAERAVLGIGTLLARRADPDLAGGAVLVVDGAQRPARRGSLP